MHPNSFEAHEAKMPRVSSDLLLGLAYVSRIADPDELRSRFFESLREIDPSRAYSYQAEATAPPPGAELIPIATLHSSFGYALACDKAPRVQAGGLAEEGLAGVRNAFQFLAVLFENRLQAGALASEKATLERETRATGARLREQEERYRNIFDNRHVMMLIIRPSDGRILAANQAATDFYGYPGHGLLSMSAFDLNEMSGDQVRERLDLVASRRKDFFMARHRLADGSARDVEVHTGTIVSNGETVLFSIIHDVTARLAAEAELRTSLAEKDILLRELHHRVKNNLQIISSMLSLQLDTTKEGGLQAEFIKAQNRIYALALLHERLYQSEHFDRLDLGEYLKSIVSTVIESGRPGHREIGYSVDVEKVEIEIDKAIPCGLIVNELVTNVIKHAFAGTAPGHFALTVRRIDEGRISLCVSDDGVSPEKALSGHSGPGLGSAAGIGLQLVEALVGQLGGTLLFESRSGTRVEVVFPEH